MTEKKVKRVYKSKLTEVVDVVQPTLLPYPETVEKSKYLKCLFCGNKQIETNSKDETAFWCIKCGRCNPLKWTED
jgi:ribosomal protein S27E